MNKRLTRTSIMKFFFVFIMFLSRIANPAFAEPLSPPRSISVTGEATMEVEPDQATLSGQLESKNKNLVAAKKDNDILVEKIITIAKEFQIPKEKINASNVYIAPEYTWNSKTDKKERTGYSVSRNLTIIMDKIEIHEQVLSRLIDEGIDQINNMSFTVTKPEEHLNKLRVEAVKNARAKAELLADAAGAKLGKVLNVTANDGMHPMPFHQRMALDFKDSASASVAPSLPGLESLSESVSVTYELE